MKSKIFNSDQIRAIQDRRMTQFMQVVKHPLGNRGARYCGPHGWEDWHGTPIKCPFGKVGDVIYCKETWRIVSWDWEEGYINIEYKDGIRNGIYPENDTQIEKWIEQCVEDACNAGREAHSDGIFRNCQANDFRWRPAATMTREAARLFLRITNIRVEKSEKLTDHDAIKQGYESDIICGELWSPKDFLPGRDSNNFYWIIDFEKTDKP